jgi:hypothetical protein
LSASCCDRDCKGGSTKTCHASLNRRCGPRSRKRCGCSSCVVDDARMSTRGAFTPKQRCPPGLWFGIGAATPGKRPTLQAAGRRMPRHLHSPAEGAVPSKPVSRRNRSGGRPLGSASGKFPVHCAKRQSWDRSSSYDPRAGYAATVHHFRRGKGRICLAYDPSLDAVGPEVGKGSSRVP